MPGRLRGYVRSWIRRAGFDVVRYREAPVNVAPPDFEPAIVDILARVQPFTMTSPERVYALCKATEYVSRRDVPGAVVECGVWRGGSMMAVALMLLAIGRRDRDLYLFDSFEGMSRPGGEDVWHDGSSAEAEWRERGGAGGGSDWCRASLDEVRANVLGTGYPAERVHIVKGLVEDTIPGAAPDAIALLRLDTDWYESTRHEMEHLYPRVPSGGILIVDDYGCWRGARKAVDEYFGDRPVLLNRIDHAGRIAIKP